MDLLRACYTTEMQFDNAGQIKKRVRWFFAAPGAKIFPVPSLFCSSNYSLDRELPIGPGEVWSSTRPFSNGATPPGLTGQGSYCGPLDWFVNGTPSDAAPLNLVNGVPRCCVTGAQTGSIGIKVGLSQANVCGGAIDWQTAIAGIDFAGFYPPVRGFVTPDRATHDGANFTVQAIPDNVWGLFGSNGSGLSSCLQLTWTIFGGGTAVSTPCYLTGHVAGLPNVLIFTPATLLENFPGVQFCIKVGHDIYAGNIGVKVGMPPKDVMGFKAGIISTRHHKYFGSLGIEIGITGVLRQAMPAAIGIEVGLVAAVKVTLAGLVGVEVSPVSALRSRVAGSLGVKISPTGRGRVILAGDVGVKAGLASLVRVRLLGTIGAKTSPTGLVRIRLAGTVGVKPSPTGQVKVKLAGSVGVKVGPAGSSIAGIGTHCCASNAVPTSLTVVVGVLTATATYSSGAGGWSFVDPSSGLSFVLKCVLVSGTTYQWRCVGPGSAHCTQTYSVTSLVCHPFSVTLVTHYNSDIRCVLGGDYGFTIHA
jgi:hypothetical protein